MLNEYRDKDDNINKKIEIDRKLNIQNENLSKVIDKNFLFMLSSLSLYLLSNSGLENCGVILYILFLFFNVDNIKSKLSMISNVEDNDIYFTKKKIKFIIFSKL